MSYIYFSLETTGLNPEVDDIIKVEVVDKQGDHHSELVHTENEIKPIITKLTGITQADVSDTSLLTQNGVAKYLKAFLQEGDQLVGYNNHSFHNAFLKARGMDESILTNSLDVFDRLSFVDPFDIDSLKLNDVARYLGLTGSKPEIIKVVHEAHMAEVDEQYGQVVEHLGRFKLMSPVRGHGFLTIKAMTQVDAYEVSVGDEMPGFKITDGNKVVYVDHFVAYDENNQLIRK